MIPNQISPFEYVSILISLILGLGITQLLSALTDLLYQVKKIKFYWPHSLWIGFILFLHIQDWFITYQLKEKTIWNLPELLFVLLYPISLFAISKMLLPTNEREETRDLKLFYLNQYPVIFFITGVSILLSILFNIFLLHMKFYEQIPLFIFLSIMIYFSIYKTENPLIHKAIALTVSTVSVISVIIQKGNWTIS